MGKQQQQQQKRKIADIPPSAIGDSFKSQLNGANGSQSQADDESLTKIWSITEGKSNVTIKINPFNFRPYFHIFRNGKNLQLSESEVYDIFTNPKLSQEFVEHIDRINKKLKEADPRGYIAAHTEKEVTEIPRSKRSQLMEREMQLHREAEMMLAREKERIIREGELEIKRSRNEKQEEQTQQVEEQEEEEE